MTGGLRSPRPMADLLPAVLQEDPVVLGLASGLDEVLAPAFSSLDCLDVYLDPMLAPPDFLARLAYWVGVELDERWPVQQSRAAVADAVEAHRCRGTARGLQWQLDLATGGLAEVVDSGGVRWSATPSPDGPADPPSLLVRLRRDGRSETDLAAELAAVERLVASAKPAHLPHKVELVD
jgi:phage tail-like protein